jgi:hypothetical protein
LTKSTGVARELWLDRYPVNNLEEKMYQFAYCFSINDRVQWSAETAQSLERRLEGTLEKDEFLQVVEFIETARPGEFITVNDGTLILRSSSPSIKVSPPAPRSLFDVLDEAGLLEGEGGIQFDRVR